MGKTVRERIHPFLNILVIWRIYPLLARDLDANSGTAR
jgi:hypothetical protein